MVKAPVAGRVKRRLARDIGDARAIWFYRNLSSHIVMRLAKSSRWTTYVALTPDTARVVMRYRWRGTALGQGAGDLGARMTRLLQRSPPGPTIIVGSDIPGVTERRVMDAFAALCGREAVFGPADDGGYWLVGIRRKFMRPLVHGLFSGVRWSSEHTLADTLKTLGGHSIAITACLGDVDDGASYARLARSGGRLLLPAFGSMAHGSMAHVIPRPTTE
jgi:rSAM/selenodomain-associated transferase 1